MDLFGTAGIRGPVAETVTPELALAVGRAVAADVDDEPVVVGRDGRTTGEGLAAAVTAGLLSGGADVRRAGVLPTPALAFASQDRRGVMLTASHNPPHDDGIKVFVDGEEYDREGERRIEQRVAAAADSGDRFAAGPGQADWDAWGGSDPVDPLPAYREAVVGYAADRGLADGHPAAPADPDGPAGNEPDGEPLAGLSVVVDCGNGMASLATPQVLADLGADVDALNANVDGHFPARESKPTAETLADQRAYMSGADADLGVAHDGDADRIVILNGDGEVVHEDTVVAVLAAHYVRHSDAGGAASDASGTSSDSSDGDPVVVTTPNASGRIDERVEAAGGRVERVRLGALHEGIARVRREGTEATEVAFAAEPWKHVHTRFGGWIDGVVSAAVVARLVANAGGLGPLREPVTERPYRKVSVDCPDDRKAAAMERVADVLPGQFADADVSTDYGVRASLPDGSWVLVRPSGTEPYLRVYAESDDVDELVATAVDVVEDAVAGAG